jgi:signal transduction histidine kinase
MHVIDRTVKKALDLVGVQVHGDDAIGTGGVEHVRNQAGRDGFATAVFFVLARVGVERQDCGDAFGGAAFECIDHKQLFHQPFVERLGM